MTQEIKGMRFLFWTLPILLSGLLVFIAAKGANFLLSLTFPGAWQRIVAIPLSALSPLAVSSWCDSSSCCLYLEQGCL